jgi:hypothetical protein
MNYSAPYRCLRFIRIIQFLASIVCLGLLRYYDAHLELVPALSEGEDQPFLAVEGILIASVLYTLLGLLMTAVLRQDAPKILRWLWALLDITIVGTFIAVAALT